MFIIGYSKTGKNKTIYLGQYSICMLSIFGELNEIRC